MSLEDALDKNTEALEALTNVIGLFIQQVSAAKATTAGATAAGAPVPNAALPPLPGQPIAEPGKPRGRPPKSAAAVPGAAAATSAATPAPAGANGVTYEQARDVVMQVVEKKGHPAASAILAKYGAKSGRELKPEHYAAVMADAKTALAA